jgi:hypothetical protein
MHYNKAIKRKEEKQMREQLLDQMISMYGFEHEAVIQFAELMGNRNFTDEMLTAIVNTHLTTKILKENSI